MTYAVCHLLASKDRCEPPCLSLGDWWVVSFPSVCSLSQLLASAVAILRNGQTVLCKLMLTCQQTWADRWTPPLTLPSSTAPGSHSYLGPVPVSPGLGLSGCSEASLAGVTVAQFAVCAAVVKSISWWLEKSWIPPKVYGPLIYTDNMTFLKLVRTKWSQSSIKVLTLQQLANSALT